jgi:homoserine kinase
VTGVHVRVPATSANLGPGFDALGLALALHNEVIATEADRITVALDGEGAASLPSGEDNIVVRGVRLAFAAAGRPFRGCALRCVNRVPLARGLGSSAAAWVGGLAAGNALLGGPLDRAALVALAASAEGHPDNVAAAVLGGLTVSCSGPGGATAVSLRVAGTFRWVVLIPEMTSSTADARAVLPATVPRADAVFNLQRVALLVASLTSGRADTIGVSLDDRLHQPYRSVMFPWMEDVSRAARMAGALGCVLSGAGPALLALVAGDTAGPARAMEQALGRAGLRGSAVPLAVDLDGVVTREVGAA